MNLVADQADGLRRLLSAGRSRIIAVAGLSRGVGATTAAMNLGVELARSGKTVLLLDEHAPAGNSACRVWSAQPAGALADVAARRMSIDDAAASVCQGMRVLPAPAGDPYGGISLRTLCPEEIVVIDVALDRHGRLSPLAKLADELVVIMQPTAASITATYAGLKQLQFTHALQTFQFVVNAAASRQQADVVSSNVVNTSSRFLAVSLRPIGSVTSDIMVPDAARLCQCVCQAYPFSAPAVAFRAIAAALLAKAVSPHRGPAPDTTLAFA